MDQLFATEPDQRTVGFAHVALERGIDSGASGLAYAIPEPLADLDVGSRVIVPLGRGNKPVSGYVVGLAQQTDVDPAKIKHIISRDPQDIRLTRDMIDLARWIGSYYCCPLGMVFATMLPAAVKRGIGTVRQTMVSLPAEPDEAASPNQVKVTPLQQSVLDAAGQLADVGDKWVEIKRLADTAGARSVSSVNQLIRKHLLVTKMSTSVVSRLDKQPGPCEPLAEPLTLNPDQNRAFDRLADSVGEGLRRGAELVDVER